MINALPQAGGHALRQLMHGNPANVDSAVSACGEILHGLVGNTNDRIVFNFGPNITIFGQRQEAIGNRDMIGGVNVRGLCVGSFQDLCNTPSGNALLTEIHTLSSQQTTAVDETQLPQRKVEVCFTKGPHGSCAPAFEDNGQTLKVIININEFLPSYNTIGMPYLVNTDQQNELVPNFVDVKIPISVGLAHELGHVRQALLLGARNGHDLDAEGIRGKNFAFLRGSVINELLRDNNPDLEAAVHLFGDCWHTGTEFCNILPFNFNADGLGNTLANLQSVPGNLTTISDGNILHEILQLQGLPAERLPIIGDGDQALLTIFRAQNVALVRWGHTPIGTVAENFRASRPGFFREALQNIASKPCMSLNLANLPRVSEEKTGPRPLPPQPAAHVRGPGDGKGGCCNVA